MSHATEMPLLNLPRKEKKWSKKKFMIIPLEVSMLFTRSGQLVYIDDWFNNWRVTLMNQFANYSFQLWKRVRPWYECLCIAHSY